MKYACSITLILCFIVAFVVVGCTPPATTNVDNSNDNGADVGNDDKDEVVEDNGENNTADDSSQSSSWSNAYDPGDAGFISAAWGPSPDDIYFVGGQPDSGAIIHYDGTSYSDLDIPQTPLLVWAYGFGPDCIYVVGEEGAVLHSDGESFEQVESNTTVDLFGVWGAADDDVWIVGGNAGEGPMIIVHFDGDMFNEVPLPDIDRTSTALFKVWGTAADNVFAVGEAGVVLHYDGDSWSQQDSDTSEDLVSLWGTGPDNIVAVGGRANGAVITFDGTAWSSVDVFGLPGLNGVYVNADNLAILGGVIGTVARFDSTTGDFTQEASATTETIHAVFGDEAGRFYAVGGRSFTDPFSGVITVRTLE